MRGAVESMGLLPNSAKCEILFQADKVVFNKHLLSKMINGCASQLDSLLYHFAEILPSDPVVDVDLIAIIGGVNDLAASLRFPLQSRLEQEKETLPKMMRKLQDEFCVAVNNAQSIAGFCPEGSDIEPYGWLCEHKKAGEVLRGKRVAGKKMAGGSGSSGNYPAPTEKFLGTYKLQIEVRRDFKN